MTLLEQEIIEKINQLDIEARHRVFIYLQGIPADEFDFEAWSREADAFRESIQKRIGEGNTIGALEILRELREE